MKKIFEGASVITAILFLLGITVGFGVKVHRHRQEVRHKKHAKEKIEKQKRKHEEIINKIIKEQAINDKERHKKYIENLIKDQQKDQEREDLQQEIDRTKKLYEEAKERNRKLEEEIEKSNFPYNFNLNNIFSQSKLRGERKEASDKDIPD